MNKLKIFGGIALLGCLVIAGCSSDDQKDNKDMRNALAKPPKFDMNNVPEKYRAMVEAMTGLKGGGPPPGVSAPPGTSAPK